ncbi:hypothetical protein A3A95_00185 [Candidatus Nomurabacteria bacterium RIFCSPLOWO2_01_FULL_39_18]|uniref:Uncharacterized protein n=1 Tax=Candidatus Nomurabacteria bacterium RIFCSPHIGHO2_01_FULL_40_24b TaxID=1801739 RepID=A0A1F6V983_9BACT|nr:MAG: hypothetical protein A2647_03035 [Candidatus Nomurabacteria bacterium RIFCSPHIGHO2_01_FULL_40_24b]OGI90496.1 MAG: hypothetical protein A3A95_00185 [Candidatus Nomurabacteria bacterium RIFCSPLOWO2_01_FULL_39_18]
MIKTLIILHIFNLLVNFLVAFIYKKFSTGVSCPIDFDPFLSYPGNIVLERGTAQDDRMRDLIVTIVRTFVCRHPSSGAELTTGQAFGRSVILPLFLKARKGYLAIFSLFFYKISI